MNVYDRYEHAGVIVEIVHDDDPGSNPMDNDNAGRILSWSRDFSGDETIIEPLDEIDVAEDPDADADWQEVDLATYMRLEYDAALTIPLRYSDYGSSGARIYLDDDDPNCALVFTSDEIAHEWPVPTSAPEDRPENMRDYVGGIEGARSYGEARVRELDDYLQGNVWGIVVRERSDVEIDPSDDGAGEIIGFGSVWGFIGDPDSEWIRSEARELAEGAAEEIAHEREEAHKWACADVETL